MRRRIKATRLDEGTCSICLKDKAEVDSRGKVNSCDHFFCFDCILEWSKLNPSCPKCKEPFRLINKHYLDPASGSAHSHFSPNRVIVKPIAALRSPDDDDDDVRGQSYGDGSFDDSNETDLDFIVDRGEKGPALAELMWREECNDRRQDNTAAAAAGSSDTDGSFDVDSVDGDTDGSFDVNDGDSDCSDGKGPTTYSIDVARVVSRGANRCAADESSDRYGSDSDSNADGDGDDRVGTAGGGAGCGARGSTALPDVRGGLDNLGGDDIEAGRGAGIDFGRRWGSERARSMAVPARPVPRAKPLELLMRGKENALVAPACHPHASLRTSLRRSDGAASDRWIGQSSNSSRRGGSHNNGGQQPRKNGLDVKIVRRRKPSTSDGKPGELVIDYAPTSGWLGGNAKTKNADAKKKLRLG